MQTLLSFLIPIELQKEDSSDRQDSPEGRAEVARKISQQMIEEASTPFTSALASTLYDGAEAAKKVSNISPLVIGNAFTFFFSPDSGIEQ